MVPNFITCIVLDRKAENVPGDKAGIFVYAAVKERVRVGVLYVQQLSCHCNVTCKEKRKILLQGR